MLEALNQTRAFGGFQAFKALLRLKRCIPALQRVKRSFYSSSSYATGQLMRSVLFAVERTTVLPA